MSLSLTQTSPTWQSEGIQLQLEQNENDAAVAITGEVGDLLGTKVDIAGEISAGREQLNLNLTADNFDVATEQWKNLPVLPQDIDKNVTVDGNLTGLACKVTLKNEDLIVDGSAKVGGLEVGLPQFDLPVSVTEGNLRFDTKQIELADMVATVDGSGQIQGKAVAGFAEFPIKTTFDTKFENVLAKSLRKIVVAIPDILNAEASGTANGTVVVESSTRTTISLTADAAGTDGAYGQIKAKTLGANVVIENLIFDDQLNYESIEGVIDATAQTDQQSVADVLKTFELDSFQQQMQIVGNASGKMRLQMPLATAEDMRTWKLQIEGGVPTGSVSQKKLVDATASVQMTDGILQFNPVNVRVIADDIQQGEANAAGDSNLKLNVRWPMVEETVQGDKASIVVSGADVPATWLIDFLQNQIETAAAEPAAPKNPIQSDVVDELNNAQQPDALSRVDQLTGSVAFETTLTLPTATPDDLFTWLVDGNFRDSKIDVGGDQLQDLAGSVRMDNGQLTVKDLSGRFANQDARNGSVGGAVTVDLKEQSQTSADLDFQQLPLPWLVSVARELLPQYADELAQPPIDSLVGQIDAKVKYETSLADNPAQTLGLSVNAAQLSIAGQQLQDLDLKGSFDGKQIKVTQLTSRVGESGNLNAQGTYSVEANQAAVTADAKQLPLAWLVSITRAALPQYADQLQQPPIKSLSGRIDATVNYRASLNEAPVESLNVSVSSGRMEVLSQELRNFKLDGIFDGKQVKVTQLTSRVGDSGDLDGQGEWSVETNQAAGKIKWDDIPIALLSAFTESVPSSIEGNTNGELTISTTDVGQAKLTDYNVVGAIGVKELQVQQFKVRDLGVDVATQDGDLLLKNFRNANGELGIDIGGKLGLEAPYPFEANGKIARLPLTEVVSGLSSIDDPVKAANLTGVLRGDFDVKGQIDNFDWQTDGKIDWLQPTYNGVALEDIKANWDLKANEWEQGRFTFEAFDGSVELVDLANIPGAIRFTMKDVDADQLATIAEVPTKLTGKINGELLLKNYDKSTGQSANLTVTGKSIGIATANFGNFQLEANYENEVLEYDVAGSIFSGKLTGKGSTDFKQTDSEVTKLPLELTLVNASVDDVKAIINSPSLRPLTGKMSAKATLQLGMDGTIAADGRAGIDQAKWDSQLITRQASLHFKLANNLLLLDGLEIDLKRGVIDGRATIPLAGGSSGRYELAVRNLDLERLTEIYSDDLEAHGLLDARLNGQIGRQITGRGFVGVHEATVNGVAGQSLRLPIQFNVAANSGNGKIELRRSTFRIFDGNASGRAELSFGNSLNVDVDMKFSNVDTEKMLAEVAGVGQSDQGKLTGRLKISGRGVRTTRNLKGSFRGSLQQVAAFDLPVVTDISRLVSVSNLQAKDFDSNDIELLLSNNQIEVKQLNFSSSLVKIAITGKAFLDGRLNLSAAARVDNLQQPTLLDELAGSPLASLNISPVAQFARLSEFLSDRIVFLKIGGTFTRPQVRVDTQQQLPAEVIRYFLPTSNVLPSPGGLNN